MKKFQLTIQEVTNRHIEISADSLEQAIEQANERYDNEDPEVNLDNWDENFVRIIERVSNV